MKNAVLMPFTFDGTAVRLLNNRDEPWFVLADVCRILEIGNPSQAASRLDDDEKTTLTKTESGLTQTDGTLTETESPSEIAGAIHPNALLINESGLYRLILRSNKPAATRFRKWVTAEVLPTIRRTGRYELPAARAAAQLEQSERSTAYRELPRIMEKLLVARNREQRRVLEAMAGQLSATLGIEPPAPDTIGSADPDVADRIAPFFKALAMLDAAGIDYNHSRQAELIAVNMNDLARLFMMHHQGVTIDRQLKADLQFSTRPRFVRITTVNSRLSHGSRQCFVFARDAAPLLV